MLAREKKKEERVFASPLSIVSGSHFSFFVASSFFFCRLVSFFFQLLRLSLLAQQGAPLSLFCLLCLCLQAQLRVKRESERELKGQENKSGVIVFIVAAIVTTGVLAMVRTKPSQSPFSRSISLTLPSFPSSTASFACK